MENIISLFENADPFKTWWPAIFAIVVGILFTVRTIMSGQRCPNDNDIKEQIVIVTGGNSGIGYEIAKALAGRGGRVILACRNMPAAERAAAIIKRELRCQAGIKDPTNSKNDSNTTNTANATATATGNGASGGSGVVGGFFVEARYLDLSSFDNVRRFARNIMAEFDRIDVLVNNAGVIFHPANQSRTVDGYEMHLQVNYLSHFLLTQLLLPHLSRALRGGRVINVSAHAHAAAKIDFDDPLNVGTWSVRFHARDAFAHSKLAVLLSTRWLARELKDSSITVNCLTPGLVRGTSHLRYSPLMSSISVKLMTFPWMWLFMKNSAEGAQCAIRLASDPKLKTVSGEYFNDCEVSKSSPVGNDKELAKKLYMQTVEELQKVTKLDIDRMPINGPPETEEHNNSKASELSKATEGASDASEASDASDMSEASD